MAEVIQCPSCHKKLRVPENLIGKNVKCPACSTMFVAEVEEDLPTAPLVDQEEASPPVRRRPPPPKEGIEEKSSRLPSRPAPRSDEEEETEEEEYEEEARPRPRRRPMDEDDEAEDEEEPRPRRRRLEEDYEDEEEEMRPRRPRRGRRSRALSAVAGPAIALMVIGGLSIALYSVQVILLMTGHGFVFAQPPPGVAQQNQAFEAGRIFGGVVGTIIAMSWAGVVLGGGYKMKNLESYGLAMTASIMAMIPCNICCLVGLPFGIWSLVVLNKPEVKNAFR
jgi:predicted Zn finger-like uncharacterized protein